MTVAVKEHPILFSGEMVRAILDGTKTETRRVIKPQPQGLDPQQDGNGIWSWNAWSFHRCPFGTSGDRLWVREAWCRAPGVLGASGNTPANCCYRASRYAGDSPLKWTPAIHMPRWASRLQLKVTEIGVQFLQEMDNADARAEGVTLEHEDESHLYRFKLLWDSLNAKRGYGWETDPWVWVIRFQKV